MAKTVLITGANRGIGLALTNLYQQRGERVIAVCRNSSEALAATGAHVIAGIDVTAPDSIQQLKKALAGKPIDILINNAGILRNETLDDLNYADIHQQFLVNAIAPLRVVDALQANLKAGSKLALITSRMGSIADNSSGGFYGYRMSKAALNAAGKSLAMDLAERDIAVAILHPGFVATEMVGYAGDVSPEQAASNLIARIDALNISNTGTFWHANGEVLPW